LDLREAIRAKALGLGFDAVGFTLPSTGADAEAHLSRFLELGYHGDMGWLAANAERRASPTVLWDAARSVVVFGVNYGPSSDPLKALERRDRGAISVYAQGADYHDTMKRRLRELAGWMTKTHGCEVKLFVDTAPVMEKPLAARAGLGWQGKHTNLVSREFGSWLFLGEIYTTLALEPDAAETDRCGSCARCQEVCPTGAFPAPYKLDARRCISYLTIEHKGHIAVEFRAAMGNRIYGCDDCLAVCPWNKFATQTREYEFLPRAELTAPRLADLVQLDDAGFRRLFAGSAIKRIGRDRFVRNALIALGNSRDAAHAPLVERLLDDASPLVRAMAVWALSRLVDNSAFAKLRERRLKAESDPEIRREWAIPNVG
jgi:epoxyqueuosine reductase